MFYIGFSPINSSNLEEPHLLHFIGMATREGQGWGLLASLTLLPPFLLQSVALAPLTHTATCSCGEPGNKRATFSSVI